MARYLRVSMGAFLLAIALQFACSDACESELSGRSTRTPELPAPDWLTLTFQDVPDWQYVGDRFNVTLLARVDGTAAPELNPSLSDPSFSYTVEELESDSTLFDRFDMTQVERNHYFAPVWAKCARETDRGRFRAFVKTSLKTTKESWSQTTVVESKPIECRRRPDPPTDTFNSGVTGPERIFQIPNIWGNIDWESEAPHVLGVAGAGGLAIVDPASGEVLAQTDDESDLLGATVFEARGTGTQNIPTHNIAVYGNQGWRMRTLGWSPMPGFNPANTSYSGDMVFDVSGWGDDALAPGAIVVGSETFRLFPIEFDSLVGYRSNFDLMTDADDFPDVEGGITSAWMDDGDDDFGEYPILAVSQGSSPDSPGGLYRIDKTFFGSLNGSRVGAIGTDPRTIRCVDLDDWICAISNFSSDTITVVTFDDGEDDDGNDDDGITIGPEHPVGDGPIDIYVRSIDDDEMVVVTAGFNDNSLHRHIIDASGQSNDATSTEVPEGCTNPNGVVPVDDSLAEFYVACNGTDNIAIVSLPALPGL